MKLAHSPKTFTFIFISFAFLTIQFGLINHFLAFQDQDPFLKSASTQSIPDTYLPVVVDTVVDQAPSESTSPGHVVEIESSFSPSPDTPFSSGGFLEDTESTEFYTESPVGITLADVSDAAPEASGGAGIVSQEFVDLEFESFVEEVKNGDADTVTGLYVAGLFKLKVLQQPPQDVAFVSNELDTATQFQSPALYGVIGLLAHNFLSGKQFYSLVPGQEIRVIFGNGIFRRYKVSDFSDFERMTRFDIRSDFRDLKTDEILSSKELFARFYREGNYLTLQTCLEGGGYSNWGVRMISAVPIDNEG
jgi:hypothetical protein